MGVTIEDIIKLIVEKTGCRESEVRINADIDNDLGCTGDDFDELIAEFAQRFDVDMNSYLWYFHTYEEGHTHNIGRWFVKVPPESIERIPVTPSVLLESANLKVWSIVYPAHSVPK